MVEQSAGKINLKILFCLAITALLCGAVWFLLIWFFSDKDSKTYLASPYNNLENYQDVFNNPAEVRPKGETKAGVVSHHFLAKQLIANFYNQIAGDKIQTVFLISPDHFNNFYPKNVEAYTSFLPWNTPFGILEAEKSILKALEKTGQIQASNSIVGLEHGISVEIPFIKKFFPNAKIVPIVAKNNANLNYFKAFGRQLEQKYGQNSIFIVSSDFSHNATQEQAKSNDSKSIDELKNIKLANFSNITNDCKQCLAALAGFLHDENYRFNLAENKNSFDFSNEDPNFVTSYVSGFFTPQKTIKLFFVGDLMFDRGIRYYASKNGGNDFVFNKISAFLANNDINVTNLEGPITPSKSISSGTVPGSSNNYIFTFDPSLAKTLHQQNIRLVGLGNNHILNFGREGLKFTKEFLNKSEVDYLGEPDGKRSIIKEIEGLKIGFVAYNQFSGDPNESEKAIEEIKKIIATSDFAIILCHWGEEYQTASNAFQRELAHKFIDAGADAIIGSHPHVVQESEDYNGKKIYYSLGNFVFDQYFEENVRNGLGVAVEIDLATKQLKFEEKKLYLQSGGQTIIKE